MNAYPPGISLCMIVKNEERFLADALRSVAGVVDEMCIVDTGSTDATIAIATAFGARIVEAAWRDDFAQARNLALAMATRRWTFVLDADERLAPGSRDALAAIGRTAPAARGVWIACRNLASERSEEGALTNALVRIFPNDARIRYRNRVHEFVTFAGSPTGLPADRSAIEIVHHGYLPAVIAERRKGERNMRLARRTVADAPCDPFGYYNLGMASVLAGDPAAAIPALEQMNDLCRDTPRGYRVHGLVVLAELHTAAGTFDRAHELLALCLGLVPTYANAHFARGKLLARRGELFAAREAFGAAIRAGAHDADHFVIDGEIAVWKAHREIGATLMREYRYEEALAWFDFAARARPALASLAFDRARANEALGRTNAAHDLYARVCATGADMTAVREFTNFLLRSGRSDEALATIEATLGSVGPADRTLLLATVAAVHARAERGGEAQRSIARALDGTDPEAQTTLLAIAGSGELRELRDLVPTVRASRLHIAYASPA